MWCATPSGKSREPAGHERTFTIEPGAGGRLAVSALFEVQVDCLGRGERVVREHGLETSPRHPYILAGRDRWPQNILVPEVVAFIESKRAAKKGVEAFPLHKYIHHGLSSQALLFNLMGPFVARGEAGPLAAVLSANGVHVPVSGWAPEFEYCKRAVFNEDSGQPTSIDLALRSPEAGVNVFVECKFVEREFGQCSVFTGGDCDGRNPVWDLGLCYLHHIGRRYWNVALEHGLLDGPLSTEALCPSRSTISSSVSFSWLLKRAACSFS